MDQKLYFSPRIRGPQSFACRRDDACCPKHQLGLLGELSRHTAKSIGETYISVMFVEKGTKIWIVVARTPCNSEANVRYALLDGGLGVNVDMTVPPYCMPCALTYGSQSDWWGVRRYRRFWLCFVVGATPLSPRGCSCLILQSFCTPCGCNVLAWREGWRLMHFIPLAFVTRKYSCGRAFDRLGLNVLATRGKQNY